MIPMLLYDTLIDKALSALRNRGQYARQNCVQLLTRGAGYDDKKKHLVRHFQGSTITMSPKI